MNKERILALADAIEQGYHQTNGSMMGFDMDVFYTVGKKMYIEQPEECGSVGCIAGWVVSMYKERKPDETHDMMMRTTTIMRTARQLLDLGIFEASVLFQQYPQGRTNEDNDWTERDYITPAEATLVLRHLAVTGDVDWSIIDA